MLPGFRFLFAALVLSMSALVFGFGAAALLRTAHEEFASTPALYAPPETRFAQATDTTKPVLALLRVDDPPKETPKETVKDTPKDAASDAAPLATPAESTATTPPPVQPEQTAALQPVDQPPTEAAKTEPVAAETPPQPDAAPAQADVSAATSDVKVATTEPTEPAVSEPAPTAVPAIAAPVVAEQASEPTPSDIARSQPSDPRITTKIATLGGPPVEIAKQPVVKAASAKPDTSAVKKQAQHEHKRRRISARARLARQQAQPADPFAPQPTITTR